MRLSLCLDLHLQHGHAGFIFELDWYLTHLPHGVANFTEVLLGKVTGADIPAINPGGLRDHPVNHLRVAHLQAKEENRLAFPHRHIISDILSQGGLTHSRSSRQDDQVGLL